MSTTVDVEDATEAGLSGASEGEWRGVMCPEPKVLPASISNALKARVVDRVREQPRKT